MPDGAAVRNRHSFQQRSDGRAGPTGVKRLHAARFSFNWANLLSTPPTFPETHTQLCSADNLPCVRRRASVSKEDSPTGGGTPGALWPVGSIARNLSLIAAVAIYLGWAWDSAFYGYFNLGPIQLGTSPFAYMLSSLHVFRPVTFVTAVVAIVGINSFLFDIMPADLRARSEVLLDLNNRQQLSQFSLDDIELANPVEITKTSSRYPLHVTIRVEHAALAKASGRGYWPALLAALGLGLTFGMLLVRARRAEGPVADLDRALARGEFKPFFQPTFNLTTGEILGCEMLARWIREDGTIVPPMKFIPLAEQSGRIRAMTWQILAVALRELNAHLRQNKEFKLSFNVVPSHLMSEGFVDTLREIVSEAKVSARQIVLEITERDELQDLAKAAEVVRELRELGFKVAIDDVGVGHSGLSHLKALGANTMKIDKFFVDTIRDGSTSRIVETLVRLAKDLQMTVVAEGIETEQQVQSLLACGVQEGQGYIVSPPLPYPKFIELVEIRQACSVVKSIVDEAAKVA